MPNWVYNSVRIIGAAKDVKKVKDQVGKPIERVQNVLSEKGFSLETVTYDDPIFSFWNVIAPPEEMMDEYLNVDNTNKPTNTNTGDIMDQILEQMAVSNDWYHWNNRNWGTKWDVAAREGNGDTCIQDDSPGHLLYSFETAWAPPVPVIKALSEQNPDVVVFIQFTEEQGWGGLMMFRNGQMTEIESWDWFCYACDTRYENTPKLTKQMVGKCPACYVIDII